MKKNHYTEKQVAFALKQAELGTPISEVCRKLGIAEHTFYHCRSMYGSIGYKQEGLNLRKPSNRKKISAIRSPEKGLASTANECWCMDFLSDHLYNGKRFRALTVLYAFSRESLAIRLDKSD